MRTVQYYIVASRGRNPDNPSDRSKGIHLEQRFEINIQGICNCLTSVSKDNMVLEILNTETKDYIALDEQNNCFRYETFGCLTTDGSSPKHNNRVLEIYGKNSKETGVKPSL